MFPSSIFTAFGLISNTGGVIGLLYSDWNQDVMYDRRSPKWEESVMGDGGIIKSLPYSLSKKQKHRRIGLVLLILGFVLQLIAVFV